jgi:hypothetical protein
MSAYRILLGPIADGAVLHQEGSIISLAEADAAPLLDLGIIEPAPEVKKERAKAPPAAD